MNDEQRNWLKGLAEAMGNEGHKDQEDMILDLAGTDTKKSIADIYTEYVQSNPVNLPEIEVPLTIKRGDGTSENVTISLNMHPIWQGVLVSIFIVGYLTLASHRR